MSQRNIPYPPRLAIYELPESEQEGARLALNLVGQLRSYIQKYDAALDLIQFCDSQMELHRGMRDKARADLSIQSTEYQQASDQYIEATEGFIAWREIAADSAVLSLYHFWMSMVAAKTHIEKAPILRGLVPHSEREAAVKAFKTHFPNLENVRNAVAHEGDLTATTGKHRMNAMSKPFSVGSAIQSEGTGVMFSGFVDGELHVTINNDVFSLPINETGLTAIEDVYRQFCSAIQKAEVATFEMFEQNHTMAPVKKTE